MKKEYPELDMNHISFQDYVRSVFLCDEQLYIWGENI